MVSVVLTGVMRVNVEGLLGQQRGNMEELALLFDIRNKVKLDSELRARLFRPTANGVLVDEKAILEMAPFEVSLENEEVRRLRKIIKEWQHFTPLDMEWIVPLMNQL